MKVETITRNMVSNLIPARNRSAHKGDFGDVLAVVGSVGMAGAAALSVGACLRTGVGLVRAAVPHELFGVIHTTVPEATCIDRKNLTVNIDAASRISYAAYDALLAGPGLGISDETQRIVLDIVRSASKNIVLDADALNIVARNDGVHLANCIITPHPGEAGRLLGVESSEIQRDRESAVRELAEKYGAVVLLKGHETLVAVPEGMIYMNPTGNPGMATAGSGDVLSGVILALLGQGLSMPDAAVAGAYIHGYAGDIAARQKGFHGLIASDIKESIPAAICEIQG